MKFTATKLAVAAACAQICVAGAAPEKLNSPEGAVYEAVFEKKGSGAGKDIEGKIQFSAAANGTLLVKVDVSGLPEEGGPFPYHIHELPVPADGNCTATKLHFNPFNGTVNATTAAEDEIGNLAGKHGNLETGDNQVEYAELYGTLDPKDKSYIGGLSVVIHAKDNSRIACANITEVKAANGSNSSHGHGDKNGTVEDSNGAGAATFGAAAVLGAGIAMLL